MSHVAMGQHVCEVCGVKFESGEILLHKMLRDIPDNKRVTGWGICPEHQELNDKGYVHLVEADEKKSTFLENGNMSREGAYRTGRIIHMKREAASHIFNVELPAELPMVFIDIAAFNQIAEMAKEASGE